MPESKSDPRTGALPSRQILLSADKEELVERIESLQADLQRRMDLEEELLHLNLQKGTASLQAQVEEASRRFKVAQQELEAFRLEILQAEGNPAAQAPRPYIYEDLSAPPREGPDRSQLRGLLAAFRRLRDERDRLRQESEAARKESEQLRGDLAAEKTRAEKAAAELATLGVAVADFESAQTRLRGEIEAARAEIEQLRAQAERKPEPVAAAPAPAPSPLPAPAPRIEPSPDLAALKSELHEAEDERDRLAQEKADASAEVERLRLELEEVRSAQERSSDEASSLRAAATDLDVEIERLRSELKALEEKDAAHTEETADLGRKLAYEQARTEHLGTELRTQIAKLAETARLLEEAKFELENPTQSVGFEQLEKFLERIRLKGLLEKNVRGPQRKDQPPAPEMIVEIVGATIGAQERPLEGARNLLPRIHRPSRLPGLGQLRQFIEDLRASEVDGVRRVHDALRMSFFAGKKAGFLTIDLDSPELVIDQRPKPSISYWPLVAYVPELQEFWHGELRSTPENAPKAIADFVAESLSRAPSSLDRSRLRWRTDARFYGDPLLRLLEAKKCSYVIAAPESAELRSAARTAVYGAAGDGWESGEWVEKGRSSQAPALRFLSLRHPRSTKPQPALPPTFRDPQHVYHVFAVDKKISPRETLDCFAARPDAEEREHALLRDVSVNRLLSRGADAHATFLPLFLLSADLLQWYRRGLK